MNENKKDINIPMIREDTPKVNLQNLSLEQLKIDNKYLSNLYKEYFIKYNFSNEIARKIKINLSKIEDEKKQLENRYNKLNDSLNILTNEKIAWINKDNYMMDFLNNNGFQKPNELTDFIIKYKSHICKCDCKPVNDLTKEDLVNNPVYKEQVMFVDILRYNEKERLRVEKENENLRYDIDIGMKKRDKEINELRKCKEIDNINNNKLIKEKDINIQILKQDNNIYWQQYKKYLSEYSNNYGYDDHYIEEYNLSCPIKNSPVKNKDYNLYLNKIIKENKIMKNEIKNKDNIIKTNNILNNLEKNYLRLDRSYYVEYENYLNDIYYGYYDIIEKESIKREKEIKTKLNKNKPREEIIFKKCPIYFSNNENIDKTVLDYYLNKIKTEYELSKKLETLSPEEIVKEKEKYEGGISRQRKKRLINKLVRCTQLYTDFKEKLYKIKFNISAMIDFSENDYKIWYNYLNIYFQKLK